MFGRSPVTSRITETNEAGGAAAPYGMRRH